MSRLTAAFRAVRRPTIARDLILCNLVAVAAISMAVGWVAIALAGRPLEQDLRRRADRIAGRLSQTLAPAVWNLDGAGLQTYLREHALWNDLVEIRVRTQYDDVLARLHVNDDVDTVRAVRTIAHEGEAIGSVEVLLSRQSVHRMRRAIALSISLSMGLAALVIGAATSLSMNPLLARPLRHLAAGIRGIAGGDYRSRLPPVRHADIDAIHREVNAMAGQIAERTEALHAMSANLEKLVAERTAQLTEANARLREETEQRRLAQERSLEIGDLEQQRIGRDLHDTLGQHLTGTSFTAATLARQLHDRGAPEAAIADQVLGLVKDGISQTRRLAKGLAPVDAVDTGLAGALEHLTRNVEDLFRIPCVLHDEGTGFEALDGKTVIHLYRIASEALNNAARHGSPTSIEVRLSGGPDEGRLVIRDNGRGFKPTRGDGGMGMWTMRARAEMIGGQLTVQSLPGAGTTLAVSFPLRRSGPGTDAPPGR